MGCFLVLVTMLFFGQHVNMTKPRKLERGGEERRGKKDKEKKMKRAIVEER